MDNQQLHREYNSFCSMHTNPPSFETWQKQRIQQIKDQLGVTMSFRDLTEKSTQRGENDQ